LSAVTLVLGYFTWKLGVYAAELNRIEKDRDRQRKLDLKVYQLSNALITANQVMEISAAELAWRISLRTFKPFVQEVRLLEELRSYTFLLEEKERPLSERLISEALSNCDNARLGGPIPTQEAMKAQIDQLKERVALQIGKLRDQRDEAAKRALGIAVGADSILYP